MAKLAVAILLLCANGVFAGTTLDVTPRLAKTRDTAVYIDRTHPLVRGLMTYILMANVGDLVDLVHTKQGATNGTWVNTPIGLATQYNGTTDTATMPASLSGTNKASLAILASWNTFDSSNATMTSYDWAQAAGSRGLIVRPSHSTGAFYVGTCDGDSAENGGTFTRPTAVALHSYVFTFDRTTGGGLSTAAFVDGRAQGMGQTQASSMTGNFSPSTMYLMSTNGNGFFGAGRILYVAVYNRLLTSAEAMQLAKEPYAFVRPKLMNTSLIHGIFSSGISRSRVLGGQ